MPDRGQEHTADSDDGFLVTTTCFYTPVTIGDFRRFLDLVQRCVNSSEKQCLIFVSGQGGGRRQCGGIVD